MSIVWIEWRWVKKCYSLPCIVYWLWLMWDVSTNAQAKIFWWLVTLYLILFRLDFYYRKMYLMSSSICILYSLFSMQRVCLFFLEKLWKEIVFVYYEWKTWSSIMFRISVLKSNNYKYWRVQMFIWWIYENLRQFCYQKNTIAHW